MTYPEDPASLEEMQRLARRVIDRQTKNMVGDALVLARWLLRQSQMKTSDHGVKFIADQEGFRDRVYRDIAGIATIGYGHVLRIGDPITVTPDQALEMLRRDIAVAELGVNSHVMVPLSQYQFDALVSFTFNLGAGALSTSMLLSELNQGRYRSAADQFLRWDHAIVGGEKIEVIALKNRREAERAMFLTGMGAADDLV